MIRKLDENNALPLFGLPEADGQRRARIADEIRTAHDLRDMEMPQREVVDARRKQIRPDLGEGADVQLPHPVAVHGLAAGRKQMPHGDNRDGLFQQGAFLFGRFAHPAVMGPDPLDDFSLLVLDTLPGLGGADIAVPEIGDGADDEPGLPVRPVDDDQLIRGRIGCAPHRHGR